MGKNKEAKAILKTFTSKFIQQFLETELSPEEEISQKIERSGDIVKFISTLIEKAKQSKEKGFDVKEDTKQLAINFLVKNNINPFLDVILDSGYFAKNTAFGIKDKQVRQDNIFKNAIWLNNRQEILGRGDLNKMDIENISKMLSHQFFIISTKENTRDMIEEASAFVYDGNFYLVKEIILKFKEDFSGIQATVVTPKEFETMLMKHRDEEKKLEEVCESVDNIEKTIETSPQFQYTLRTMEDRVRADPRYFNKK